MDYRLLEWLTALGLERYAPVFATHEVNWSVLFELTEDDLREMELPVGPRRRIASAIAAGPPEAEGTPELEQPGGTAERRPMTIVFCDMVGYTPITVRFDPEDVRALVLAFQETVAASMRAFDGYVANYMGDGVLAYFGWPHAYENQAERATLAAIDAIAAINAMSTTLPVPVEMRAGVASGRVVVGSLGEDSRNVTGETVNLAQRLQSEAKPGEAVMDEATRRLVGRAFYLAPLGALSLKGFPDPVDAFVVRSVHASDTRFDAARPAQKLPLIGRESEYAALRRCWAEAEKGGGQLVVVRGEAGTGKSRLLRAFRDEVTKNSRVIQYQCLAHYANSPLYPVKQRILRDADIRAFDDAETRFNKLRAVMGISSHDLETDLPLMAQLLATPVQPPFRAPDLSAAELRAASVKCVVAQALGLAKAGPVCLILEDAHWIDPTTEELLMELAPQIAGRSILVVVTHRPEYELHLSATVKRSDIALGRMSHDASLDIARAYGGARLTDEVLRTIVQRAEGVPLYLEELARSVAESDSAGEVPATIEALFLARLDSVGIDKPLAQLLATIARAVSAAFLSRLIGRAEADVAAAMTRLMAAGLIVRSGAGEGAQYRYKHVLIQDAAYDTLLFSVRRSYHGRIADVILADYPLIAETEPEAVARHLSRSDRGAEAIAFWQRAGELAAARNAHREAVAHDRDGLADLAALPDEAIGGGEAFALHVGIGASLLTLEGWSSPTVAHHYDEALRLCDDEGDAEKLFVALRGKANVFLLNGELTQCRAVAEQLRGLADQSGEPALVVSAAAMAGICALLSGRFTDAERELETALALSEPGRQNAMALRYGLDPPSVCLAGLAWVHHFLGNMSAATSCRDAAIKRAGEVEHPFSLAYALGLGAFLSQFRDEPEDTLARADSVIAYAAEHDFPYWIAWARIVRGWALARLGTPGEGIAEIEAGLEAYTATGARQIIPFAQMLMADAYDGAGLRAQSAAQLAALERRESGSEAAFFAPLLDALKRRVLIDGADGDEPVASAPAHPGPNKPLIG